MNRIFFKNKGHTRNLNIDSVLPFKRLWNTPIEFYDTPGLTMIMDPVLIKRSYFKCEFFVVINETASCFVAQPQNQKTYIRYDVALHGQYNKYNNGRLYTECGRTITGLNLEHRGKYAQQTQEAIGLVYEGIKQFEQYFMRQAE